MYACMAAMHACVHYLLHGLNKLPAGTRSTHVCTCDLVDELEEVLRWHRLHACVCVCVHTCMHARRTCDLVDELEEVLRWHRPHCKRPQRHEFRLPAVDREHLPKLCPG